MSTSEQPDGQVRVRLDLAYDGGAFNGWAAQPGLRTVEGILSAALATVLRTPVRLTVAGRTDSGVHAAAQVAHVDVPGQCWAALPGRAARPPAEALLTRLAGVLAREAHQARASGLPVSAPRGASDLVVTAATPVSTDFDARFSALERCYIYRIADGGPSSARDPRRRGHVLWLAQALDVEAMARSTAGMLGEHDFLSYCKPRVGATTVRTLTRLHWERLPARSPGPDAGLVRLTVVADAFCHSMVRALVGAGLAVGRGRAAPTWPAELLARRSRDQAAPVAPAHGLTLESVSYPPEAEYAAQAERARVVRTAAPTRGAGGADRNRDGAGGTGCGCS